MYVFPTVKLRAATGASVLDRVPTVNPKLPKKVRPIPARMDNVPVALRREFNVIDMVAVVTDMLLKFIPNVPIVKEFGPFIVKVPD